MHPVIQFAPASVINPFSVHPGKESNSEPNVTAPVYPVPQPTMAIFNFLLTLELHKDNHKATTLSSLRFPTAAP